MSNREMTDFQNVNLVYLDDEDDRRRLIKQRDCKSRSKRYAKNCFLTTIIMIGSIILFIHLVYQFRYVLFYERECCTLLSVNIEEEDQDFSDDNSMLGDRDIKDRDIKDRDIKDKDIDDKDINDRDINDRDKYINGRDINDRDINGGDKYDRDKYDRDINDRDINDRDKRNITVIKMYRFLMTFSFENKSIEICDNPYCQYTIDKSELERMKEIYSLDNTLKSRYCYIRKDLTERNQFFISIILLIFGDHVSSSSSSLLKGLLSSSSLLKESSSSLLKESSSSLLKESLSSLLKESLKNINGFPILFIDPSINRNNKYIGICTWIFAISTCILAIIVYINILSCIFKYKKKREITNY